MGPLFESDSVATIAHRGGANHRPENTLAAFDYAVDLGADMLELDIHRTADDHLVVHHDPTVDRTTDGSGAIADMPLETLQSLDAGYGFGPDDEPSPYRDLQIPRLETVLERYSVPMVVELKDDRIDPASFVGVLERTGRLESVVIGGFDDELLAAVRERAPVVSGLGMAESRALVDDPTMDPPAEVLFPPVELLTADVVQTGHDAGLTVVPWTVNEPSEMERAIDLGVDGIVTDDPKRLLSLQSG